MVKNVLIGTDFELFLQNKRTGEIVSAEGWVQGTKNAPYVFDPNNRFFATSLDNVLAEACIPPARTVDEWIANINKSRSYIDATLPKNLCTVAIPAAILKPKYLKTENAQVFGCDPDNNVWLRQANDPPKASNKRLRSAGGHIHVGYDNPTGELSEKIVKAMDLTVGVPSVLQEPENERKKLYGKAGAFRFKDYGVEYRTVSNYYLENENLTKWVFGATIRAVELLNEERFDEIDAVGDQIQEAINSNNKVLASNLIKQFNLELV